MLNYDNLILKVCKCTSICIIGRKYISAGDVAVILDEYEDYFGIKMIRVLIDEFEGDCSVKYFFNHFYTLTTLKEYPELIKNKIQRR